MTDTVDYYEKNADSFAAGTQNIDFEYVQKRFLKYIPAAGMILDFGCGSGRDAKYFLERGFKVDAVDASINLCKIASINTGIAVRQMLFSELDADTVYNGIWACSSILHLPKNELHDVLHKMIHALKNSGYIYTSFKYGEFEGYRNERHFTDFTEKTFREFISIIPEIIITEEWVSEDVRPDRGDEKWLNLILRKI